MDSSTIALCVTIYDGALFQRAKGAVKLHLLLDHDGYLPCFAVITTGKRHEITVARSMQFQAGTILVFDKVYADYAWWKRLTQQGVYFVTRLRDDALYAVTGIRPIPEAHPHIRRDEQITLMGYRQLGPSGLGGLRRIEVWGPPNSKPWSLSPTIPVWRPAPSRPSTGSAGRSKPSSRASGNC